MNLLFVCTMNQWRSPTAQKIFADEPSVETRSRGTSRRARRTISLKDVEWADVVMVMEHKHWRRLASDYPVELRYKDVHVLDIPDNYQFMDPELVSELRSSVLPILENRDRLE